MTKECVIIKVEFRIESEHLTFGGYHQWIHFDHRAIETREGGKQTVEKFRCIFDLTRLELEFARKLACLIGLEPGQWIHRLTNDFLGRFSGDGFDFNASFGAGYNQRRSGGAIEQDRKINLAADVRRLCDEHLVHYPTCRAGLMRDQCLAQHLSSNLPHLLGRLTNVHAAFEPAFERSLPSPAGMDLRLDRD